MFCISISFKQATTEFRGRFSDVDHDVELLAAELAKGDIHNFVYLSTCNRCELYGVGEINPAVDALAAWGDIGSSELKGYLLVYEGDRALNHLFRVTTGLESMVIGEDEILGQVKTAYGKAKKAGRTGENLNKIFQSAITAAKRVKTDTVLSKTSVSVATLAAYECHKFYKEWETQTAAGTPARKTVLVLGASGDTGSKVMKNLLSYENEFHVVATVRAHMVGERGVEIIKYNDRYDVMERADIVVSAARSPVYTVTRHNIKYYLQTDKPRLFLDLAAPNNLDGELDGFMGITLKNQDDFNAIAADHNAQKQTAYGEAEEIIREDLEELKKALLFSDFQPYMKDLKTVDHQFLFKYRDEASAEEFASFLAVLKKVEGLA